MLIIANQLKHIFGISAEVALHEPKNFIGLVGALAQSLAATQWQPLLGGAISILLYFGLQKVRPKWPNFSIALVVISASFGYLIHAGGPFSDTETFRTFTLGDLGPFLP